MISSIHLTHDPYREFRDCKVFFTKVKTAICYTYIIFYPDFKDKGCILLKGTKTQFVRKIFKLYFPILIF